MIEIVNKTNEDIDMKKCEDILEYLKIKDEIELIVTDSNEMREINRNFRSIDKTTDVLSFPLEKVEGSPLGSIVINIDMAKNNSKKFSHTPSEEFALLFLHGVLHLLGFDHETDDTQMRDKEFEVISALSLPKSLIVRGE
ncbi:MAG: rRNA maturation RNase YbeY [Epsilonproteobacteria bacterium]|nr:rRNA maturation RNase YbeY [Campylobacterota bacterium]